MFGIIEIVRNSMNINCWLDVTVLSRMPLLYLCSFFLAQIRWKTLSNTYYKFNVEFIYNLTIGSSFDVHTCVTLKVIFIVIEILVASILWTINLSSYFGITYVKNLQVVFGDDRYTKSYKPAAALPKTFVLFIVIK